MELRGIYENRNNIHQEFSYPTTESESSSQSVLRKARQNITSERPTMSYSNRSMNKKAQTVFQNVQVVDNGTESIFSNDKRYEQEKSKTQTSSENTVEKNTRENKNINDKIIRSLTNSKLRSTKKMIENQSKNSFGNMVTANMSKPLLQKALRKLICTSPNVEKSMEGAFVLNKNLLNFNKLHKVNLNRQSRASTALK